MDGVHHLLVTLRRHKGDGQTFGTETAGTTGVIVRKGRVGLFRSNNLPDAVKVRVSVGGSVVVDDDVHPLNVNTATEDISGHKDTFFEGLKRGVSTDTKWGCQLSGPDRGGKLNVPFLLGKTGVDTYTRKIARNEQLVQFNRSCNGFHEDDDLFDEVK